MECGYLGRNIFVAGSSNSFFFHVCDFSSSPKQNVTSFSDTFIESNFNGCLKCLFKKTTKTIHCLAHGFTKVFKSVLDLNIKHEF